MANAEHLEILKKGVKKWNDWREKGNDIYLDLNGANLRRADLSGADLSGADLIRADLSGTNLNEANLNGVNLRRADLSRTDLSKANLSRTDLIGANLMGANMMGANLMGADLSRANLSEADLRGANLSEADLSAAYLMRTNLREATLIKAKLNGANLLRANLIRANLSEADLRGATLREATLREADLSGSYLAVANLSKAYLNKTNLAFAQLDQTVFGLTNLSTCQNLESVEVSGECVIDFPTLKASKNLPKEFLVKLGIPDLLMEYLPDFYNPALMIYPAFLSHSWSDKPFVRKLYETLSERGVTVWLDEKKLKPGDNVHDSISEGIKYYDKLILVCSEHSLNSWWVGKELEKVYEKEREMQKERGKKFRLVIPIRIDDHILNWEDGILTTVRNSVIGDFTQWQDEAAFEKAVKELVDALNANRPDIKPPSFL